MDRLSKDDLTRIYEPENIHDMVGEKKHFIALERNIRNRTPTLVWGLPGIGKTSATKKIAKKLKLQIYHTNASDDRTKTEKLIRQASTKSFFPSIMILDEVDGFKNWGALKKIIKQTRGALVLIANEYWKIDYAVRNLCDIIEFKPPYQRDIKKRLKEISEKDGVEFDLKHLSRDMRQVLNNISYGGDIIQDLNGFDVIRQVFNGEVGNFNFKEYLVWLIDNTPDLLNGKNLYDAIKVISIAARLNRKEVLKCLPQSKGQITYPLYLRMIRGQKSDD